MSAAAEPERRLEPLDVATCWDLIRSRAIGRVAIERADRAPLVVPVSYVVTATGTIVFRTAPGTKVEALLSGRASFQVDAIDPVHRTGWSVLLEGPAEISWGDDSLPIERWVPGSLPLSVTLTPARMSGRALHLELLDTDRRGYR
jgi:hypothetical protein